MVSPERFDIDAHRPTEVSINIKFPSGGTEVHIELLQSVKTTREALALAHRVLMNTGPLQGPDEEQS